ncbi:MAG: hypothetical protein IJ157_10210 [Clostridia bacterium]|nr:hypothetical protein [Clostridia bacterium]
MKRTMLRLSALCLILLALCLGASALADTPELRLITDLPMDGTTTNYYLGLPLGQQALSDVIYWDEFIRVSIMNYDEMAAVCTGDPVWNVTQTNGPQLDFTFYPEVYGSIHRVVAKLNQAPTETMDAEFQVTCTWDGYAAEPMTVYFHALSASMPQNLSKAAVIEAQAGQTKRIDLSDLLDGWSLNGYDLMPWGMTFDSEIGEMIRGNDIPGKADIALYKEGSYLAYIEIRADSLLLRKRVSFEIGGAGGGSSAALTLQNSFPERNVYLGMPRYYSGLGPDGDMPYGALEDIDVYFENYDALQSELGGSPVWTVDVTPDIPHGFWDYSWNDQGHLVVWIEPEMPAQPQDALVTVTCDWGSRTDTSVTTLHYVSLPSMGVPADHDYPHDVYLTVGDTFEIAPSPLPMGWNIPGYEAHPVLFSDQMEAFAEIDRTMQAQNRYVYTATTAGTFVATVMVNVDTVYMGHHVIFHVADDGSVPPPVLDISSWSSPERNYYIGDGLLLTDFGGQLLDHAYTDAFVDRFSIFNSDTWARLLKGDPVWTVTADDPGIDFTWTVNDDGRMDLLLNSLPVDSADVLFTVSCDWDGAHGEAQLTVHFKKVPTLPTDLLYKGRSMVSSLTLKTGELLEEISEISFNQGIMAEPWEDKGFWFNAGDEHAEDGFVSWENGERVAGMPGEYDITVTWADVNICFTRSCHLTILEADGSMPGGKIYVHTNHDGFASSYFLGMDYEAYTIYPGRVQTDPQIDHFYLDNYEYMATVQSGTPAWDAKLIQGTVQFDAVLDDGGRGLDLDVTRLPATDETAMIRLTCDWGTAHWEQDYTVSFITPPTLPTGIVRSFNESLIARTGDSLYMIKEAHFKDDWAAPGESGSYGMPGGDWGWDRGMQFDDNGHIVAGEPGIYAACVTVCSANVRWTEEFTLFVTRADGTLPVSELGVTPWTLPAGLTRIEGQAFAGTTVEAIEIPASVTYIAGDAFDGCGPVAIYAHSQYAVDYALAHDLLVFTD